MRVESFDIRHLDEDVDDRLRSQPPNRGAAYVVDARIRSKKARERFLLMRKHACPQRTERRDLNRSLVQ